MRPMSIPHSKRPHISSFILIRQKKKKRKKKHRSIRLAHRPRYEVFVKHLRGRSSNPFPLSSYTIVQPLNGIRESQQACRVSIITHVKLPLHLRHRRIGLLTLATGDCCCCLFHTPARHNEAEPHRPTEQRITSQTIRCFVWHPI